MCGGKQSCFNTFVTNDNNNNNNMIVSLMNSTINHGNIYCFGTDACENSIITSYDSIYCLSSQSCQNSIIMTGRAIYCSTNACNSAQINNVRTVNILDQQSGLILSGDNIGMMTFNLRGSDAGNGITFYCDENDYCTIDCGTQDSDACENLQVYCIGKCNVVCDDSIGVTCPIIVQSGAPTIAPTEAPSNSPTAMPSISSLITENDIEIVMTYTLLVVGFIAFCIGLFGFITSKTTLNDWFDLGAIFVFAVYTADFISGKFTVYS